MKAQFFDRQDETNPLNGTVLHDSSSLRDIIIRMQQRAPFLAELIGENGCALLLGLGSSDGCVQFSSTDGSPPYWMAVGSDPEGTGEQNFLIGNTATPVPRRYCISMERVEEIATTFLASGQRALDMVWEEI
jgi:hypothetical protein